MSHMDDVVGLLLGLTILTILIVVAIYVLSKLREKREKSDSPSAQELLVKFGRLYDSGVLSDEEFRAIKRTFAVAVVTAPIKKSKKHASDGGSNSSESAEERDRAARLERLLRD